MPQLSSLHVNSFKQPNTVCVCPFLVSSSDLKVHRVAQSFGEPSDRDLWAAVCVFLVASSLELGLVILGPVQSFSVSLF